jgi:hypothetical protein
MMSNDGLAESLGARRVCPVHPLVTKGANHRDDSRFHRLRKVWPNDYDIGEFEGQVGTGRDMRRARPHCGHLGRIVVADLLVELGVTRFVVRS